MEDRVNEMYLQWKSGLESRNINVLVNAFTLPSVM